MPEVLQRKLVLVGSKIASTVDKLHSQVWTIMTQLYWYAPLVGTALLRLLPEGLLLLHLRPHCGMLTQTLLTPPEKMSGQYLRLTDLIGSVLVTRAAQLTIKRNGR